MFEHPVLANLVNAAELRALPAEQRSVAIERIAQGLRTIAMANARYRCCELRLQHATVHLALPELQAVGDGAADSKRAARNRARATLAKLRRTVEFALLLALEGAA